MGLLIVAGLLLLLFGLGFVTKRRFGLLGLGLFAGSVLSTACAADIADFLGKQGLVLTMPPLAAVVGIALTLLPALLLLAKGPKYGHVVARLAGALLFAALAVLLLRVPLNDALVLGPAGDAVFKTVGIYQSYMLTAGVSLAILDILLARNKHHAEQKR